MKNKTTSIAVIAIFTAFTFIATKLINITIPATGGYINLGDTLVLLSGWMLGKKKGALAAGLGSALADVIGYPIYAPGTFVIKALMAVIAVSSLDILSRNSSKVLSAGNSALSYVISAVFAESIMIVGYFIYEATVLGFGLGAIYAIPGNLIQAFASALFATVAVLSINRSHITILNQR